MKKTIEYRIQNLEEFQTGIIRLVDTSVNLSDYLLNPSQHNIEYFGEFKNGKLTIYNQHKSLLTRRIILKIEGEIKEDKLSLEIRFYPFWVYISNVIFLTIFSMFVMYRLDFYVGLGLISINIIQFCFVYSTFKKCKDIFIKRIEELI